MDAIRGRVLFILEDVLTPFDREKAIDDNADLRDYGMDSLNCIRVIIYLESMFDIQIPADLLGLASVKTVRDICKLVSEVIQNEPRI